MNETTEKEINKLIKSIEIILNRKVMGNEGYRLQQEIYGLLQSYEETIEIMSDKRLYNRIKESKFEKLKVKK